MVEKYRGSDFLPGNVEEMINEMGVKGSIQFLTQPELLAELDN